MQTITIVVVVVVVVVGLTSAFAARVLTRRAVQPADDPARIPEQPEDREPGKD